MFGGVRKSIELWPKFRFAWLALMGSAPGSQRSTSFLAGRATARIVGWVDSSMEAIARFRVPLSRERSRLKVSRSHASGGRTRVRRGSRISTGLARSSGRWKGPQRVLHATERVRMRRRGRVFEGQGRAPRDAPHPLGRRAAAPRDAPCRSSVRNRKEKRLEHGSAHTRLAARQGSARRSPSGGGLSLGPWAHRYAARRAIAEAVQ